MKYYPIADRLSQLDALSLNLKFKENWNHGYEYLLPEGVTVVVKKKIHSDHIYDSDMNNSACVFRCPLEGEWFLSGATPAAYKAKCDLTISYYIVEPVLVKEITIKTQVEVTL